LLQCNERSIFFDGRFGEGSLVARGSNAKVAVLGEELLEGEDVCSCGVDAERGG
jgi:hypothetical protein